MNDSSVILSKIALDCAAVQIMSTLKEFLDQS